MTSYNTVSYCNTVANPHLKSGQWKCSYMTGNTLYSLFIQRCMYTSRSTILAWHIQKLQTLWKIKTKMCIVHSKYNIITDFLQNEEEEAFVFFQFQWSDSTLLIRPEHLPLLLWSPCTILLAVIINHLKMEQPSLHKCTNIQ